MGNEKLSMIIAINKALDYKRINSNAEIEEILRHVMKEINFKGNAKIAAIAAATEAIKYKEKNPQAKDKEILQAILNRSDEILNSIEKIK
ncbi:MAG: hypothetical protein QXK80_01660 [Candidatus Pacearchaeota archaeon]